MLAVEADRVGERGGVRRVLLERPPRHRAELLHDVRLEQMRAAVDDVHRLARGELAGKALGDEHVGLVERVDEDGEGFVGNRRVSHQPSTV